MKALTAEAFVKAHELEDLNPNPKPESVHDFPLFWGESEEWELAENATRLLQRPGSVQRAQAVG